MKKLKQGNTDKLQKKKLKKDVDAGEIVWYTSIGNKVEASTSHLAV
ncbi:MAG: hypothetical protein AB7E42_10385 [Anaerotignaceae bacterium]